MHNQQDNCYWIVAAERNFMSFTIRKPKIQSAICLLLCVFLSGFLAAEGNSLVLDTQNLLPKIEAYYQAIDKQLNKRAPSNRRDPFVNTLPSAQHIEKPSQKGSVFSRNNLFKRKQERALGESEVPKLSFRGILQQGEKKIALLNIEGQGTFVVKEGDKVGIQRVGSSAAVLHILEINDLNLIVETGSYKEKMVVQ